MENRTESVLNGTSLPLTDSYCYRYLRLDENGNWSNIPEFLECNLGPRRLPFRILLPITGICVVFFITGMLGNICTCLVIARKTYMHTATNLYLLNLAVADMLTLLIGMPAHLYSSWNWYPWPYGNTVCKLKGIFVEAPAFASILTIVAFTTERYVAVCYPMRLSDLKAKLYRALKLITILWIVAFVFSLPYGLYHNVHFIEHIDGSPIWESAICSHQRNDHIWLFLDLASTLLFFVLPMSGILIMYGRIAIVLHRHQPMPASEAQDEVLSQRRAASKCRVLRMLVAVVIAFFISWAPFHAHRLLFVYVSLVGSWTPVALEVNKVLRIVGTIFYYVNSTVNPLVYSVMSQRFRAALKATIVELCCCQTSKARSGIPSSLIFNGDPLVNSQLEIPVSRRLPLENGTSRKLQDVIPVPPVIVNSDAQLQQRANSFFYLLSEEIDAAGAMRSFACCIADEIDPKEFQRRIDRFGGLGGSRFGGGDILHNLAKEMNDPTILEEENDPEEDNGEGEPVAVEDNGEQKDRVRRSRGEKFRSQIAESF
ncbi:unnamed protein product [Cyprideis torosa]|uniref:Uncharacterized protein n=1 Tax=Cyprideis torosa TaxID=163714 RepID=A0A7R8ZMG3_9CRUS|nr:unnamed protein product [Cyprideis torosa]CAG0895467.1 unnamed protein product [Cyprideis torosa]